MKKTKADGICGICGYTVPPTNDNLFYCDEGCRREAWRRNNPHEIEPDWDDMRAKFYGIGYKL